MLIQEKKKPMKKKKEKEERKKHAKTFRDIKKKNNEERRRSVEQISSHSKYRIESIESIRKWKSNFLGLKDINEVKLEAEREDSDSNLSMKHFDNTILQELFLGEDFLPGQPENQEEESPTKKTLIDKTANPQTGERKREKEETEEDKNENNEISDLEKTKEETKGEINETMDISKTESPESKRMIKAKPIFLKTKEKDGKIKKEKHKKKEDSEKKKKSISKREKTNTGGGDSHGKTESRRHKQHPSFKNSRTKHAGIIYSQMNADTYMNYYLDKHDRPKEFGKASRKHEDDQLEEEEDEDPEYLSLAKPGIKQILTLYPSPSFVLGDLYRQILMYQNFHFKYAFRVFYLSALLFM